jgi:hypothetical protein
MYIQRTNKFRTFNTWRGSLHGTELSDIVRLYAVNSASHHAKSAYRVVAKAVRIKF